MKLNEALEVHEELNPVLWNGTELKEDVKNKLLQIANTFIEGLDIPLNVADIRFLGSNASYTYNSQSDIDLHIISNFDLTYIEESILQQLYNAKKNSFNDKHNISIKGIPVEIYIEDMKSMNATNGSYSLLQDQWIKEPQPIEYTIPDISQQLADVVSSVEKVLISGTKQDVEDTINIIYLMRKDGLATEGEASIGNLVFKETRNLGLLDKLRERFYELESEELTLEHKDLTKLPTYDIISEEKDVIVDEVERVNKLDEGSMSRLLQHANEGQMAFITAWRNGNTRKENSTANNELSQDLQSAGLSFSKVKGGFVETLDDVGNKLEKPVEVTENTFAVYNNKFFPEDFVDLMVSLCKKYNQDSVLVTYAGYVDEQGNGHSKIHEKGPKSYDTTITARYYDKDGNVDMEFSGLSLNDVEQYFTSIGNTKFRFLESIEVVPCAKPFKISNQHEATKAKLDYTKTLEAMEVLNKMGYDKGMSFLASKLHESKKLAEAKADSSVDYKYEFEVKLPIELYTEDSLDYMYDKNEREIEMEVDEDSYMEMMTALEKQIEAWMNDEDFIKMYFPNVGLGRVYPDLIYLDDTELKFRIGFSDIIDSVENADEIYLDEEELISGTKEFAEALVTELESEPVRQYASMYSGDVDEDGDGIYDNEYSDDSLYYNVKPKSEAQIEVIKK